jgi:hypothetical protein
MSFKIIGKISAVEVIAVNTSIRDLERLKKVYGEGRWRKLKGVALVELENEEVYRAEIHWYEAHGIGRKEFKIKYILDDED